MLDRILILLTKDRLRELWLFSLERRRGGSGETIEHLPLPKGGPGELERNLGQGLGVIGQGRMASGWQEK